MKKLKTLLALKNQAGGYDLLTERDAGNEIRILTGRYSNSLSYWKRLAALSKRIVKELEDVDESQHEEEITLEVTEE